MDATEDHLDVCIIGAGWSGLLACKYAREYGLNVVVLEQRDSLGGVWNFSEDPNVVTVMASTITSSSATVTEASDFPMNPKLGRFIHQKDIHHYLEAYAQHFDLNRHIVNNQTVQSAEKQDSGWLVHTQDRQYRSQNLVVCAGPYQGRRRQFEVLNDFTGNCEHIGSIKSIAADSYSAEDHVLVYGGGESASDVVELLAKTPARITWAIPDGQHFFRKSNFFSKLGPGQYRVTDSALDEASSRCIQHIVSFSSQTASKPGMKWLCILGSTGSVLGYEGHGIPEWKKNVPFMHAMVNKNGHAVEFVHSGRATAKGKIVRCEGDTISFVDGTSDTVTHVILCTGYEVSFPYLPPEHRGKSIRDRYKLIFDPDDPSLLLIGYARPVVSSIPLMTEIQCQYAFRVLAGNVCLPDKATILAEIEKDNMLNDDFFHHRRRAENLVSPFIYGYGLAKKGGFHPNYLKLFFQSPIACFKTFFSPTSAAHFLLMDKSKRAAAVDLIWSHQQGRWLVFPWIYVIARLLKVDVIIDWMKERKYRKQLQQRKLEQDSS